MRDGGYRSAAIALAVAVGLATSDSRADNRHRLREVRADSVDLIARVAWNWNAPPDGHASRAYLQTAMQQFANRTYSMTEGRLRICKVHLYYQRSVPEADIRVELEGRSHATIGGLRTGDAFIEAFTRMGAKRYSADEYGDVLAHEFGHYGLFLKDEYTEKINMDAGYESPRHCDVTLNTTMAINHVPNLSLPSDYDRADYPAWGLVESLRGQRLTQEQKYLDCSNVTPAPDGSPKTENAMWRTSQWRTWRMSAWELITGGPRRARMPASSTMRTEFVPFRAIAEPGIPRELRKPELKDSCHEAIFHDDSFVVLLIDGSNSMRAETGGTLPSGAPETYLDRAKRSALKYLETAPIGTTVSIVHFASSLTNVAEPTKIESDAVRTSLMGRIEGLPGPNGNTGLDAALLRGEELVLKHNNVNNWQYIIAITDGTVVVSDWVRSRLAGFFLPVFTHGVGGPNTGDILGHLSRATRGAFRNLQPWQHEHIMQQLPVDETVGYRFYGRPMGSTPLEEDVAVSEVDGATSFRALWKSTDKATFELVAPDGTVISPGALPPDGTYESHGSGATYYLPKPQVGKYKTRIVPMGTPTGDFTMDTKSESPLRLKVEVTGSGTYPEPWFVRAHLTATRPVVGASVKGVLQKTAITGTTTTELKLRDDGVAPDELANDGVYTAAIATVRDDGAYELTVTADNPGGAKLDANGVAHESEAAETPKPISAFTRTSTHALEAKSFREMPRTSADALKVRNDYTPLWIAIDKPGDAVWVSFNGYRGGRYVAMTGDTVPTTDQPIKTKLSLYAPDGTTLLAESAEPDGRALVPVHTAKDQDGVYFLKIEGSAPGRLRVAVAPEDWFLATTPGGDEGGGDGCDCRAAGRAGSPWALTFALLYAIRRYARRARS